MNIVLRIAVLAALVGGCTNKPIPDNYAKISTFNIVQKVRCESQSALRDIVVDLVREEGKNEDLANELARGVPFGFIYEQDPTLSNIEQPARGLIQRYINAGVGYTFTFDITENNNVSGGSTFLDVITGGTFNLGITANNNQARQNQRILTVSDKVSDLVLNDIPKPECGTIDTGADGLFYPIKGDLGLKEFYLTFFNLDRFANLISEDKKSHTLTDTMTFTTELVGEIKPSITLSTGVTNITLGGANLGAKVVRKDVHKLALAISLDKQDTDPNTGERISPKTLSTEENNAIKGLEEQRLRLFLQNAIISPG